MEIDVKKVAKTAMLNLDDKEVEIFQKEFEQILKFFEDIKDVKTEGVEPAFQPIELKNVTRADKIGPSQGHILIKVKNRENSYFKGPKVV
jgi:aspartyl-tRNA(Asn)/glutamyl-tRNA(Gln) amidotransferase subunit C